MNETLATILATLVASGVSVLFGYLSLRSQALAEVGGLYDQLVRYRADHPDVMRVTRLWKPGDFARVYGEGVPFDRDWALYYGYAELCISYCNAVLSRTRRGRPPRYLAHHLDLVRLVMAENAPLLGELVSEGSPYVSAHIRGFWQDPGRPGWDWAERHRLLAT